MQHLEVSCAVRRFFKSLGFKGLTSAVSIGWAGWAPETSGSVWRRQRRVALPEMVQSVALSLTRLHLRDLVVTTWSGGYSAKEQEKTTADGCWKRCSETSVTAD